MQSNLLSAIKSKLVNLAFKNHSLLKRWIKSISIILKKKLGNIDMRKFRAILLLEADFNAANKIIFNIRLILTLKYLRIIPNKTIEGYRAQSAM